MRFSRIAGRIFGVFAALLLILFSQEILDPVLAGEKAEIHLYPNEQRFMVTQGIGINLTASGLNTITAGSIPQNYNAYVQAVKDFGLKWIRFPGGCETDSYNWKQPRGQPGVGDSASIDEALQLAQDTNTEIIYQLPVLGLLELEKRNKRYVNPCGYEVTARWSLTDIEELVNQYSLSRKAAGKNYLKYFELGNEEWGFLNAVDYITAAKQASETIRSLLPEAVIIGVSNYYSLGNGMPPYGAVEYPADQTEFDYITEHAYWFDQWREGLPEGESLWALDFDLGKMLNDYETTFTPMSKFQKPAITEWNLFCWDNQTYGRPHRNNQKFEHSLYVFGHLIKQLNSNVPFSIYHSMIPTEQGSCNLVVYQPGQNNYPPAAPAKGLMFINGLFGKTHIKSEINSPQEVLPNLGSFPVIIGTAVELSDGRYQAALLNRSPSRDVDLSLFLDNLNSNNQLKIDASFLSAPFLNSSLAEITTAQTLTNQEGNNGYSFVLPHLTAAIVTIEKTEAAPLPPKQNYFDIDDSGTTDINDLRLLTNYLLTNFSGADINHDGLVNSLDAGYLINYLR